MSPQAAASGAEARQEAQHTEGDREAGLNTPALQYTAVVAVPAHKAKVGGQHSTEFVPMVGVDKQ